MRIAIGTMSSAAMASAAVVVLIRGAWN